MEFYTLWLTKSRYRILFALALAVFSLIGCTIKPMALPTQTHIPENAPTPNPTHTNSPAPTQTMLIPTPSPTPQALSRLQTDDYGCLIFFTQSIGDRSEIFFINCTTDPPEVYQVTNYEGASSFLPRWSPDMLSFSWLQYSFLTQKANFWVQEPPGEARQLTQDGLTNIFLTDLYCWTNDQRFLIYMGPQPDGTERDIYRVEIETGEIVNLTADSPVWNSDPMCSPTEDLVAFVSDRFENSKLVDNIWVMASDGSGARNLTNSTTWENISPGWSPDGKQIAFFRYSFFTDSIDEEGPPGLWVVDPVSGEEQLVVQLNDIISVMMAPVWSPDGRYIAYSALSGSLLHTDIFVVSLVDGSVANVSNSPGDDFDISWSPDSQLLMFTNLSENGEHMQLFFTSPNLGVAQPLFEYTENAYAQWAPYPYEP